MLIRASLDHAPLQQCWFLNLADFDFYVEIFQETANNITDAMSWVSVFIRLT